MKKTLRLLLVFTLILSLCACGKEKEEKPEYIRPDIFEGYDETTLVLKSDGSILEIVIEDYNAAGIDYSDVKQYIEGQIDSANSASGTNTISLAGFTDEAGIVRVAIEYTDINSYNTFNGLDTVLTAYDMSVCDEIAEENAPAPEVSPAVEVEAIDWASLSDEELAEAGYTREDVESGALEQNIEGVASGTDAEPVVATFTDASSGAEIVSSDIDSKYMMFITDQKTAVKFDDGNVLYYTGNGSRGRTDKEVICNGEGKTVIVFEFNYAY